MNEIDKQKNISEDTLQEIKSGQVKMHSRLHFVLRGVLLVVAIIIIIGLVLFFVTLAVFSMKSNGLWYAPGMGFLGIGMFLKHLPWVLILLIATFIIGLEYLLKNKTSAYRRPLLYSAVGILILVILLSVLVGRASLHERMFDRTKEGSYPILKPLYGVYGDKLVDRIYPVRVVQIGEDLIDVQLRGGEIVSISITPDTKMPLHKIKEGDHVVIWTDGSGDRLVAEGIKHAPLRSIKPRPQVKGWEGEIMDRRGL